MSARSAVTGLLVVGAALASRDNRAAGINTDVALPVRQGGFVLRTQVRLLGADDDPSSLDREVRVWVVPAVVVYGATVRTTVFGIVPYLSQRVELTEGGRRLTDRAEGTGDLLFLVRRTVRARDAIQRTSRLGLLGGVELPSGSDAFSSHATDFLLGGVYTLQDGRHEVDADLTWKVNGEGRGVDPGDEYRADLAYQFRLTPAVWPDRGSPSQVYGVIEANWSTADRAVSGGAKLDDTGGTSLFLSPGVQLVTRKVIYEASVQLPAVQNLNGEQAETDFVASIGVRINF
jgi:hypothetical protein